MCNADYWYAVGSIVSFIVVAILLVKKPDKLDATDFLILVVLTALSWVGVMFVTATLCELASKKK